MRKQKSGMFSDLTGGALELKSDSFCSGGREYAYDLVTHIKLYARRTSVNFLPLGEYAQLQVWLEGRSTPITIENPGLIGTASRVRQTYEQLVKRTFERRVRRYMEQIEQAGYFEYDGAKFFPDGEVVVGKDRFNVRSSVISLGPFRIVLKAEHGTLGHTQEFNTEVDRDVFLSLLKALYGLEVA